MSQTIPQVAIVQPKPIESHFVVLVLPKGSDQLRCRPRSVQIQAAVVVLEVYLQVQVKHREESFLLL